MRLDGPIRRFQVVPLVTGSRVLTCEKNMQLGMFEVSVAPGRVSFSSPHDYEVVEHLMREMTPSCADDPCIVSCLAWQRGPAAQATHDLFCLPLLTSQPPSAAHLADNVCKPFTRESAQELVYLTTDVSTMDGVQRVSVAFDPVTLFELCANLAEKWPAGGGTVGISVTLPCSPSSGRRFQPWKDVAWIPSDRQDGPVSQLARRLFGRP